MEMGKCAGVRHTVTAADVTAGAVVLDSDMLAITGGTVTVRDAAGALKAWTGTVTVGASGRLNITNTGGVDFIATDTLDVVAY